MPKETEVLAGARRAARWVIEDLMDEESLEDREFVEAFAAEIERESGLRELVEAVKAVLPPVLHGEEAGSSKQARIYVDYNTLRMLRAALARVTEENF